MLMMPVRERFAKSKRCKQSGLKTVKAVKISVNVDLKSNGKVAHEYI